MTNFSLISKFEKGLPESCCGINGDNVYPLSLGGEQLEFRLVMSGFGDLIQIDANTFTE